LPRSGHARRADRKRSFGTTLLLSLLMLDSKTLSWMNTGRDKREVRERGKGRKQRRTTFSNDILSIFIGRKMFFGLKNLFTGIFYYVPFLVLKLVFRHFRV
jgi:hypothetical protein